MKNIFKIALVAILALGATTMNAQDEGNRWSFALGVNAIDLYPVGEEDAGLGGYFDEFFNYDHYNIMPFPSRVQVGYYVSDNISATGAFSVNQITKAGENRIADIAYAGLDLGLQYNAGHLFNTQDIFDPFVGVGGGYNWLDDNGFATFNGTLGFDVYILDNLAVNIQSTYRHAFEDDNPKHFQHVVGLKWKWGGSDTDGDGIYDDKDNCPEVAGLKEFMGCPDSDGDGIEDSKDNCPNNAGPAENMGCPDTDGDGVLDKDDNCVNVPGPAYNKGCADPDTDGDGVVDSKDRCKTVKGPASNNGCPVIKDADKDGVVDAEDKCPNTPGLKSLQGCPKPEAPSAQEQAQLNQYAKTILFDTSKSTIKAESARVLADITAILKKYPDSRFTIDGHTDSSGSDSFNQRLSESRAQSVMNYLISNGVNASRLTSAGYGESRPVADNSTKAGKAQNRRVEINLIN